MKKKKVKLISFSAVLAALLVLVIAVNAVALYWSQALLLFFGTIGGTDAVGYTKAYADNTVLRQDLAGLVREIVDEGSILLKNDGALPLAKDAKVTLLGQGSVNWLSTGTGSSEIADSEYSDLTLKKSLEDAGFAVNETVWNYYSGTGKRLSRGGGGANAEWKLNETDWAVIEAQCGGSLDAYNDAAVLVVSRIGCEGGDLPRDMSWYEGGADENYLELSATERGLLEGAKKAGFKKTVVILNTCNALQMDFIDDPALGVDACLVVGGTGANGLEEVGKILSGAVNPSGHTTDTYVYDNFSSPVMQNFGDQRYITASGELLGDDYAFINYAEGIYVGYKYYETRYEDKVMGTGNAGDYDYASTVAFPFGYGLSYTDFAYGDFSLKGDKEGALTAEVKVTNIGDVPGKDAVGLYYQAPYTAYDMENGVEKASVNLADFAKTKTLAPGQSEVVTFTFDAGGTMKSYDANKARGYIMDPGTYYVTAAPDAHEALNNILNAKGYTVEQGMTSSGDAALVGTYNVDEWTALQTDPVTGCVVTNQFDDAAAADAAYLSRSDWPALGNDGLRYATGSMPLSEKLTVGTHVADEELIANLKNIGWSASGIPASAEDSSEPVVDTPAGLQLADMIGADYDDPRWEQLISQAKVSEIHSLYSRAGYMTEAIESIGKPQTTDLDGGLGLTSYISEWHCFAYPAENVLAATWNQGLAEKMGEMIGEEALLTGVSGWYAPAMNIHRSPFSGRNYDYYSEDAVLSGKMGAGEVRGASSKGMYTFIKHFAVNDQETKRSALSTWVQEQAMREIYLKPFEIAVKEGGSTGIMASMNRIGYRFTRGSYALLTTVLRGEWGFRGAVITDACQTANEYSDMALAAGIDLQLNTAKNKLTDTKNPVVRNALQKAAKNTCYMVANSLAMNPYVEGVPYTPGVPVYLIILAVFDVLALAALGFGEFRVVASYRRPEPAGAGAKKRMSTKKKIVAACVILILLAALALGAWRAVSYIMSKMI